MTRNQIRDLIALRLGNRTDLDDRIVSEMQMVQDDLEQGDFLPWFLATMVDTLNNDATNTDIIELSTELPNFILPLEDADLEWFDGTKWVPLERRHSLRELQHADSRIFEAGQYVYTIIGTQIRLLPDPGEVLNFRWWYHAKDTALTADISNGWTTNAAELVASMTCAKMAPQLQMASMVQVYAGMTALALDRLRKMDEARRVTSVNLSLQYGRGNT